MTAMLNFEIKKILVKPVNKIVLLVLVAALLVGSFLTLRDVTYTTEGGEVLRGISAAKELKSAKNEWKGELTEDVLRHVIEENQKILAETPDLDEAFVKQQGLRDIHEMLNNGFAGFDEWDYYRADSLSPEEAAGIYQIRVDSLKEYLSRDEVKDTFSEKEKEFLISQWENLKTPFYYEYAEGWKALLDSQYLPTLMTLLVVILGALVAGIFSDEYSWKADSIFFSSKLGRNKAVLSKISAGFLITTVLYWASILLFTIIILGALGVGGANCPVQLGESNWMSIYNWTYLQKYFFVTIGSYIGSMFITFLAMTVSAVTRSTVIAVVIPFALSCAPMFLGRITILSRIVSFFPDMLLRICTYHDEFLLCQIGGKVMGVFTFLIPLYVVLCFVIVPVLYLVYKKAEVK